jgi:hypothetical protein
MDYLYPVPFVLAWFLLLLIFVERASRGTLFAATSFLGIGVYSYIASVIMMPVYFLLTCFAIFKTSTTPKPLVAVAAAGFIWPLLFIIPWTAFHPTVIPTTVAKYHLREGSAAREPVVVEGTLREQLAALRLPKFYTDLVGRISLYWSFFDPSFLFVSGGYAHMVNSTRRVGVFLLPLLVFVPVGLLAIARSKPIPITHALLLLGFFTAPVAACVTVPEVFAIDRELEILAFGVLIATYGVKRLLEARASWSRALAVGLLALVPLHFAFFCVDYWRDYPLRLGFWFLHNRRGALEEIIAREAGGGRAPAIYLNSKRILYVGAYWQLYTIKHHRQDLLQRTVYFDSMTLDFQQLPAGSLLLSTPDDPAMRGLVQAGTLRSIVEFPEIGNPPMLALYEKS